MFQEMIRQIQRAETISYTGKIENIVGMSIEASGGRAAVGDICQIYNGDAGGQVMAEVREILCATPGGGSACAWAPS